MRKILLFGLICGVLGGGTLFAASLPDLFMYYQRAEQGPTPGSMTRIDMVVENRGQAPVGRATIDIICYNSYQIVGGQTDVGSTSLSLPNLLPWEGYPVSVDIQTNNTYMAVACYVDATHKVQESNESNNKTPGRINLFSRYISPSPPPPVVTPLPPAKKPSQPKCYVPPQYQKPTPPPPVCRQIPQQVCSTTNHKARGDMYMSQLGLTIPTSLRHIQQYRIQRFDGSWSKRYTPGVNDIDWKDNCGDHYWEGGNKYDSKRPASCSRRVWSYFDDHTYQMKSCKTTYKSSCSAPSQPVIAPVAPPPQTYPCGDKPCDFVPLPRIPIPNPSPKYPCGDKPCDFVPLPRIPSPPDNDCLGGVCTVSYMSKTPSSDTIPRTGGSYSDDCKNGTCQIDDTVGLYRPLSSSDKTHTSFAWGSWIR